MIEKVNPSHPDKLADRIAGAIVDLAYEIQPDPKIAVEVLIGHGTCHIMIEASVSFSTDPRSRPPHRRFGRSRSQHIGAGHASRGKPERGNPVRRQRNLPRYAAHR